MVGVVLALCVCVCACKRGGVVGVDVAVLLE